jgi:hypothetical protein
MAMVLHSGEEALLEVASNALEMLAKECERGVIAILQADFGVQAILNASKYSLERACTLLLKAFKVAAKDDPRRYLCLDALCSILQRQDFVPPDLHLTFLHQDIVKNESEPRLFRARAEMGLGMRHWHDHDLEAADDCFRDVVGFTERASVGEKERTFAIANDELLTAGEILGKLAMIAQGRLDRLVSQDIINSEPNLFVIMEEFVIGENGTRMSERLRKTRCCIGSKDTSISKQGVHKIMTVGGKRCDECGKSRKEANLVCLHCCDRCKVRDHMEECVVQIFNLASSNLFSLVPI